MDRITDAEWRSGGEERLVVVHRLRALFGPYRRTRPRDQEKAAALRDAGTPEELIGPAEDQTS